MNTVKAGIHQINQCLETPLKQVKRLPRKKKKLWKKMGIYDNYFHMQKSLNRAVSAMDKRLNELVFSDIITINKAE